jgi:hypothetical protein
VRECTRDDRGPPQTICFSNNFFSVGRGENARVAIEARLKQLAISQAGQETCAWHAALGQFLGLVGVIVGLFCVILGLFCPPQTTRHPSGWAGDMCVARSPWPVPRSRWHNSRTLLRNTKSLLTLCILARRRQHLGRSEPHTCKQTVWIFCRLRGQTPGTGRSFEKPEPKYIYCMKPLYTDLGECAGFGFFFGFARHSRPVVGALVCRTRAWGVGGGGGISFA